MQPKPLTVTSLLLCISVKDYLTLKAKVPFSPDEVFDIVKATDYEN